jgi:hypothetical protein
VQVVTNRQAGMATSCEGGTSTVDPSEPFYAKRTCSTNVVGEAGVRSH